VGLRPGQSAIDLGCGPRGILELLAERVAPGGQVVGLDANSGHVAMAREFTARRGLEAVHVLAADASHTGLPTGSFDLVHARTLLVTVPEPGKVLAEMVRLAKPGGWVASMEPDVERPLCYPDLPAFGRMCELFGAAFSRHGADPLIGRRLTEMYRQAGLTEIGVEARAGVYRAADSRRTILADLVRSVHPAIVSMGLAEQDELDALDRAVRRHLDDPGTLVIPHQSFLVWGRKARVTQSQVTAPVWLLHIAARRASGFGATCVRTDTPPPARIPCCVGAVLGAGTSFCCEPRCIGEQPQRR
jgi:ubiquinone/menaquinone biosynthesis C-methylase UbiE